MNSECLCTNNFGKLYQMHEIFMNVSFIVYRTTSEQRDFLQAHRIGLHITEKMVITPQEMNIYKNMLETKIRRM